MTEYKSNTSEFNETEVFDFWIKSSDSDFNSMLNMFEKKDFHWALFTGHLVIEKLLKAFYVKKYKKHAPLTHNLLMIANKNEMEFDDIQKNFFVTVTAFNINARYDDYKRNFYKKCTKEFTEIWINKIEEMREWIKKQLK